MIRRSRKIGLIVLLAGVVAIPAGMFCFTAGATIPSAEAGSLGAFGRPDDFLTDVIPDWPGWSRNYWTDQELWGNRGYIVGGPRERLEPEEAIAVGEVDEIAAILDPPAIPDPPLERIDLEVSRERPDTHTVVKGESLWFIAGYDHIYGNPLQWPLIYKANRHRIKNPDLIYPGQTFIIPRD